MQAVFYLTEKLNDIPSKQTYGHPAEYRELVIKSVAEIAIGEFNVNKRPRRPVITCWWDSKQSLVKTTVNKSRKTGKYLTRGVPKCY